MKTHYVHCTPHAFNWKKAWNWWMLSFCFVIVLCLINDVFICPNGHYSIIDCFHSIIHYHLTFRFTFVKTKKNLGSHHKNHPKCAMSIFTDSVDSHTWNGIICITSCALCTHSSCDAQIARAEIETETVRITKMMKKTKTKKKKREKNSIQQFNHRENHSSNIQPVREIIKSVRTKTMHRPTRRRRRRRQKSKKIDGKRAQNINAIKLCV